jgi:hypothetical protein
MAVSRLSQQSLQQAFPKGNTFWDGTTATSAFDSLGSVTLASATNTITFTNIPQTYTHLHLKAYLQANGPGAGAYGDFAYFNSDSTESYRRHGLYGDGSSASAYVTSGSSDNSKGGFFNYWGATGSIFATSVADILDYSNTNKFKTVRAIAGADNNGSGSIVLTSCLWRKTEAISSITFQPNLGFGGFVYNPGSTISLYGVK